MGSEETEMPADATAEVLRLCEAYLALNDERIRIDDQFIALPAEDTAMREKLWLQLMEVVEQMPPLISKLAATSSPQPPAMRAKAAVLTLLLRAPSTEALTPEAAALALSLAEELVAVP